MASKSKIKPDVVVYNTTFIHCREDLSQILADALTEDQEAHGFHSLFRPRRNTVQIYALNRGAPKRLPVKAKSVMAQIAKEAGLPSIDFNGFKITTRGQLSQPVATKGKK